MSLSDHEVTQIAAYARIALSADEIPAMTTYLNDVIKTLEPITTYDLSQVSPTFHPIGGLANVMREDEQVPGLDVQTALENAPLHEDQFFKVPQILGGGE